MLPVVSLPITTALSPTQTLANVAPATALSKKDVAVDTLTVRVTNDGTTNTADLG